MLYFLYWRSIHFFRVYFYSISFCCHTADVTRLYFLCTESGGWEVHKFILLKSFIVLSSWALHTRYEASCLTIVGPINATRPVMTLVAPSDIRRTPEPVSMDRCIHGCNFFFMLSRSGKKEGIDFKHDRWI